MKWAENLKIVTFLSPKGVKRTISRDLLKMFEFCKMFWIANNTCDIETEKIIYIFHMAPTKVQEL